MTTAVAPANGKHIVNAIEQVLMQGNLAQLTADQRVVYYNRVCDSLGLNPLTRPFEYLTLNNKLVLYARKDCTEQLRNHRGVSVTIKAREVIGDCYVVTTSATVDGRTDESIGAVSIAGLKGDALANAYMKAETKSKRRVTLSICGLGMLDESEVESIPDATIHQPESEPLPPANRERETALGAVQAAKDTAKARGLTQAAWSKLIDAGGGIPSLTIAQLWDLEKKLLAFGADTAPEREPGDDGEEHGEVPY